MRQAAGDAAMLRSASEQARQGRDAREDEPSPDSGKFPRRR